MPQSLLRYTNILSIVGDLIRVEVPNLSSSNAKAKYGDLAMIEQNGENYSLAQIIKIDNEEVSLQVFAGCKGLSTNAAVCFLDQPMQVTYSPNILGRIFNGAGQPIDHGPELETDPKVEIDGPSVNPVRRTLATRMVRTNVPMIDVFNTLVESQKIPIFSVAGEPYNKFLARIAIQAEADVVVFAGMGLIYDDYHFFKTQFEEAGVSSRTIMFVNQASDPTVERLLAPDMALSVAEHFAVDESKKVLVLLTDMTSYADAMKEIGVSMDKIPANRGYMGDLYSQLAKRYEKACDYKGAGSVTLLAVTTMPGNDVTHPVPDNTGYITEGQFYLHDGVLDPFGSLSRLKQMVVGKETREDHSAIMSVMIRFYSDSVEAQQKQAMAFELSEYDKKTLKFGKYFKDNFMTLDVDMSLEDALDFSWKILAECFDPEETLIKDSLLEMYWPYPEQLDLEAETAGE
ncbi:V-type ATP synthase subunit B [Photobacterium sp. BZF1]|uniref:V-type ATP synthase subunit B n=1 Tax=Photobacterium rosenbergii TaxID=294936 RepID=A0A2T3MW01_9GAMM|nr:MULTISPECIES: V-type ATP synthase subunit B [Photobacterium]MBC7001951.1 V-type ATP synthase subunit B [Photobacterium sp. BZF1]MBY5945456.1 V-type ATP synthase subunit B [Photobacterium rosenbergii]PSW04134.1 V-type ATP synthase subunit B [Photobacterium rosenbergii]